MPQAEPGKAHRTADTTLPVLAMTMGDLLREAAADAPEEIGLVVVGATAEDERSWTHNQFLDESLRAAAMLAQRFAPGERIAIWSPNRAEWLFTQFGAALAGLVLVTINPAFRARETEYVLDQADVVGVLAAGEYRGAKLADISRELAADRPRIREVISLEDWDTLTRSATPVQLPDVDPDDPAMIQYTSGTTGKPKGALLSHRGMVNIPRFIGRRLEAQRGSVWLNYMPMFHTSGCVFNAIGTLWVRARHVMMSAYDPRLALEQIERHRCEYLGSVPTMLMGLMELPEFERTDISSLKAVTTGGSAIPADMVRRFESALGLKFLSSFGQTETSGLATMCHLDDAVEDKAATSGRPLGQTEVQIVRLEDGATADVEEEGEICIRGVGQLIEYFRMPDATAQTIDADGWVHTGDLGTLTPTGHLTITGRLKEMIIRGGENIYPREIEDVLYEHPAVLQAAVIGVPDPKWGEQVAAYVKTTDGTPVDEQLLLDFLMERLAAHKKPRYWRFVDELPTTASGKVQKFVLQERFAAEGT